MAVTKDDVEREKGTLPLGWGRFGKALERLVEIAEPDETLLATCVTVNPDFQHGVGGVLNVVGLVQEARDTTNVVLACTDRRLMLVFTGLSGAPRSHAAIPFAGTRVVEREKKAFVLEHDGARIRFTGAAKGPAARLLDALASRLPAT